MTSREWYDSLTKPGWTPEPSTISLIWNILYPIIIVVNVWAFMRWRAGSLPLAAILPLWINIFANIVFTPVQFGLRNLWAALVVVLMVWITIVWAMVALWPYSKFVAIVYVPYLVWVSIASALQLLITVRN